MRDFVNTFDNVSIEILLEIFGYLSINDCFHAFHNLNWKTDSALKLAGFAVDITSISRNAFNEFYKKLIFTNHSCQVRKLKLSNSLTTNLLDNFLNHFNLCNFTKLRSLTLIKPSYMILSRFAFMIRNFEQLQHLSIDSNSYPIDFFQLVTTTSSSIKFCYLPGLEIQEELSFQSKIEHLTVTIEDIALLLNLLASFSELKYLNASIRSAVDLNEMYLPKFNLISCSNLHIFKLEILERSNIDFREIEYFFQQTSFHHLKLFSYICTTNDLNHIDTVRWNQILSSYFPTIETFHCIIQIPYYCHIHFPYFVSII